jgi:hypothetical protein
VGRKSDGGTRVEAWQLASGVPRANRVARVRVRLPSSPLDAAPLSLQEPTPLGLNEGVRCCPEPQDQAVSVLLASR